jgi:hypothetical protein
MDFAKLASVLTSQTLFFPNAASLAKSDRYEGFIRMPRQPPPMNPDLIKAVQEIAGLTADEANEMLTKTLIDGWEATKPVTDYVFINSWHMNDAESDAMWKVYAHGTAHGVAIRSTFDRLKECFAPTHHDVYIGLITYIDYHSHMIDYGNAFNRFLYKRHAFAHEREVRAVCQPPDVFTQMGNDGSITHEERQRARSFNESLKRAGGLAVAIDISKLVDAIVMSPDSPEWLSDVVERIVSALGFDLKIVRSDMEQAPVDN